MQINHPYLSGTRPRAFAHRGWHLDDLDGLENSLPSFQRAAAEGYAYVETDVHTTADGVVVVHHDALLDRTTDRHGPIAKQTWSAVRQAKIGGRTPVPRLEDVLEELPEIRFNIDVKTSRAIVPFVRTIERMGAFDRVAAAAFSDARLAAIRKLAGPKLITSMGPRSAAVLWARGWLPWVRRNFRHRGEMAQVPSRQGAMTVIDPRFVRSAERAGAEVHAWTINDRAHMERLLDLGVHGIVTDRPDVLREVLAARGAWPPTK
ncbi:glycerophosphodiester phosphodiesterase [Amycolatopsis viridis]|uniref:Glycerophosphoryl diester phosphodiesterase n=1 Tax=Amycolatopsis viridis TaxID=185678 RepID=A0ABX0SYU4_9PSEU|nr:glycerophosphodiester phosphodiesterase [Amycolatopsis viridis]NIH80466.1 glycerophosphoryl diester phosphodiesterase [Amycolatopsis viridis]